MKSRSLNTLIAWIGIAVYLAAMPAGAGIQVLCVAKNGHVAMESFQAFPCSAPPDRSPPHRAMKPITFQAPFSGTAACMDVPLPSAEFRAPRGRSLSLHPTKYPASFRMPYSAVKEALFLSTTRTSFSSTTASFPALQGSMVLQL